MSAFQENENRIEYATLYSKMAKVMADLSAIEKNGYNKQGWKYAGIDQVTDAIRQSLGQNGIAFFASEGATSKNDEGDIEIVYYFTFACGDTGATITQQWTGVGSRHLRDKARNAASTNAQKYFLIRTFIMTYSDDLDPDSETKPATSKSKQQAAAKPEKQERKIQHWTKDTALLNKFVDKCIELGLGEDKQAAIAVLLANYDPNRAIAGSHEITDDWSVAVKRIEAIAQDLKREPERAAGESDDALPYHESASPDDITKLWNYAKSHIGADANVVSFLSDGAINPETVRTSQQRDELMRDYIEFAGIDNKAAAEKYFDKVLAKKA